MTAHLSLSDRASGVADRLASWPRKRVSLVELWRVLDEIDPASRIDARRRVLLSEAIEELSCADLLRLPAPGSFDRTETPHLPRFVTLVRQPAPPTPRRQVVWHPTLFWVPETRLTPDQLDILEQINDWLHRTRTPLVIPHRERSLEIFGHEKTLDRLLPTSLFEPGRLTLGLLHTRRALVRFITEPVGQGDELVIVENSNTFDSLVRALRQHTGHRIRTVGWGAGSAFEASVLSVAQLDPPVSRISYFGDLDEKGLRIPTNAAALAAAHELPPLRAAIGLYDALFTLATPQPGQRKVSQTSASAVAGWLDPQHRQHAIAILTAGERLAQEAVGFQHLLTHDAWLSDL
jgi:Protein of unknown function C-terminus (DUF2399)